MPEQCISFGSNVAGGKSYSASSSLYGFTEENAWDDNFGTFWMSGESLPDWNRVDLGSGNETVVGKFRFNPGAYWEFSPEDFTIEASNTGSFSGEEVTLLTVIGAFHVENVWEEWEFWNGVAYRY